MDTNVIEHPLSYRQEVVARLFALMRAGESCAVVGAPSAGKTRLLQHFITRDDVRKHYLGDRTATTIVSRVDGNRLPNVSEWSLYELLLTSLAEECGSHPGAFPLHTDLRALCDETMLRRDSLLALRHLELAVHRLCAEHRLSVCFILDQFDRAYLELPSQVMNNLRALRDRNRYRLCYILGLREHPARLRPSGDGEEFYELLAPSILGLGPYTSWDARRVVEQIAARMEWSPPLDLCEQILELSGGHPGLIVALVNALPPQEAKDDWAAWALEQPIVSDECRKIWGGLNDDERRALGSMAQGLETAVLNEALQALRLKGLVRPPGAAQPLFSPLFARFVETQEVLDLLRVDKASGQVWRGRQHIRLTGYPLTLLEHLYDNAGSICSRADILNRVYGDQAEHYPDNAVDLLAERVRAKIEPHPKKPIYLLTVLRKGYRLVKTDRDPM